MEMRGVFVSCFQGNREKRLCFALLLESSANFTAQNHKKRPFSLCLRGTGVKGGSGEVRPRLLFFSPGIFQGNRSVEDQFFSGDMIFPVRDEVADSFELATVFRCRFGK